MRALTFDIFLLSVFAMKAQRSINLNTGANKRSRKTINSASSSVGVVFLALTRSLATHGTEVTSSANAEAAAVASVPSDHVPEDFRVFASAIEAYLHLRASDASAARDIAFKLSTLTELLGAASNTLRRHTELPLTSSLSAGVAAGLGVVPCLLEPLFEFRVGLASAAKDGAHSTAAMKASQAHKVRQSKTHYEAVK